MIGLTKMKDKKDMHGRGGDAIVAGDGATVDLHNQGVVKAGKGGSGGGGGDAIYVSPGVKIKIINRGVIAGGDAGGAKTGDA